MTEVPQTVWNQMAKTVPLQSDWAKEMFPATPEQVEKYLDDQSRKMSNACFLSRVISSYQTVVPLLLESEAISLFIEQTGNYGLRQALPEVNSAQEAVSLMMRDRMLDEEEIDQLYNLLKPLEPEY